VLSLDHPRPTRSAIIFLYPNARKHL
jgi:hypothetical protein